MSAQSSFRGIKGIREIKDRMQELADWYRKHKPNVRDITLDRKDYDLIARWPKAAHVEGFDVTHNGIFYAGFRLTYDTGQSRYEKPQSPEQVSIR